MERRNFIKTALLGSIAAAMNIKREKANAAEGTFKDEKNDLVAVMGGTPSTMYKRAITEMGGMRKYIKKGDKVVIKPNIGWDKSPEFAADTNPQLIGAIVRDCIAAGAAEVIVFDHTCDSDWKSCYKRSGIEDETIKAGGKMGFANDERYYRDTDIPQGVRLKKAKMECMLEYFEFLKKLKKVSSELYFMRYFL